MINFHPKISYKKDMNKFHEKKEFNPTVNAQTCREIEVTLFWSRELPYASVQFVRNSF